MNILVHQPADVHLVACHDVGCHSHIPVLLMTTAGAP